MARHFQNSTYVCANAKLILDDFGVIWTHFFFNQLQFYLQQELAKAYARKMFYSIAFFFCGQGCLGASSQRQQLVANNYVGTSELLGMIRTVLTAFEMLIYSRNFAKVLLDVDNFIEVVQYFLYFPLLLKFQHRQTGHCLLMYIFSYFLNMDVAHF